MKIIIENYKNIGSLDYEISDKKVNFLFGISGAGKSSICNSIVEENINLNKQFGNDNEPKVLINGSVPLKENYMIFDESTVRNYFSGLENDFIYSIIIDDENEFTRAQNTFYIQLEEVENKIIEYKHKYENINSFLKTVGASNLTKDNLLKKNSPLGKLVETLISANETRTYKEIESMPDGKYAWYLKGAEFIENEQCPFCSKRLNKKNKYQIERYKKFDSKMIESIHKEISNYEMHSSRKFQYSKSAINSMRDETIKMSLACSNYKAILDYINKLKQLDEVSNAVVTITYCHELFTYFPNLKKPILTFNNNVDDLRKKYEKTKKKTYNLLKNKTKTVNSLISKFSIPYKVTAKYNKNGLTDYKLVHIKDSNETDSKHRLSTGEKNIISLIFFILLAQKQPDKILVIDDPVSSYDEYRRKQICDLILNRIKTQTALILSHDHVFAKYATLDHGKKCNIGNVDYIENYEKNVKIVKLEKENFGIFKEFLIEKLHNGINYYQKIINLRMIYEGKHNSHIYKYLSAILHATDKQEIDLLLENEGIIENELLEKIEETYKIKLPQVYENYYKNIDTSKFSFFEKALFYREYMQHHDNINKQYKEELDNFIHLNSRLYICLNPYKYTFCSPKLYELVNEHIKGILNVKE